MTKFINNIDDENHILFIIEMNNGIAVIKKS